jgi:hypothetical protein
MLLFAVKIALSLSEFFSRRAIMQKKSKSQDRPPLLPRPGSKPDKD